MRTAWWADGGVLREPRRTRDPSQSQRRRFQAEGRMPWVRRMSRRWWPAREAREQSQRKDTGRAWAGAQQAEGSWGGRGPAWCRVGRACEDGALTREGWALRACPAGSASGVALYPQGPVWWASPVHLHPKQREPALLRTPTRPLWRIVLPEIMVRAPSSLDTLIFSPPFNPHHPPP